MIVKDVFDLLRPRYSLTRFADIINEILILEDRLSRPNDQSIYFRWAIPSHREQHLKLKRRYTKFRYRFNEHTVSEFLEELNNRTEFIGVIVPSISDRTVRYMAEADSREIVAEMSDMIHLKGIVSELPVFAELREMPDVLMAILDSVTGAEGKSL